MSRKVRNIIFYIFIGCVAALFLLAFIVGIIYGFAGAGSKVVIGLRNFFIALGNADASFVKYSPYICIGFPVLFLKERKNESVNHGS